MSKENHIGIRYSKDGDIETYDTRTGKTTGHISTMGNMIEETKEDRERYEKAWEEAMKKHGYVFALEKNGAIRLSTIDETLQIMAFTRDADNEEI